MLSFDTKIHKQEGTGTYDLLELKINTISSSVLNLNVDLSQTWKRQCVFTRMKNLPRLTLNLNAKHKCATHLITVHTVTRRKHWRTIETNIYPQVRLRKSLHKRSVHHRHLTSKRSSHQLGQFSLGANSFQDIKPKKETQRKCSLSNVTKLERHVNTGDSWEYPRKRNSSH